MINSPNLQTIAPKKVIPQTTIINNKIFPTDMLRVISTFMPVSTLGHFAQTSHTFFNIAQQESQYRKLPTPAVYPKINLYRSSIAYSDKNNKGYLLSLFTKNTLSPELSDCKVISMSRGIEHMILLTDTGLVYTKKFGSKNFEPVTGFNSNEKIISVYSKGSSNFALTEKGTLYGWGHNKYGQLAQGDYVDSTAPKLINVMNKKIIMVSVGANFVLVLTEDNKIYSWGYNNIGQLGLSTEFNETSYNTPQEVTFFTNKQVNAVYASTNHSFVIANNQLFTFGSNRFNQLGLPKNHPFIESEPDRNIMGMKHPYYSTPQTIELLNNVPILMLATDCTFTLALTEKGELFGWGANMHNNDNNIPQKIAFFENKRVLAIFAHDYTYLVLTSDKEIYVSNVLEKRNTPHQLITESNLLQGLREAMLLSTVAIRTYHLQKALALDCLSMSKALPSSEKINSEKILSSTRCTIS